jgi:hypothetical protein
VTSLIKENLRTTLNWREIAREIEIDVKKKSSLFDLMQKSLNDYNDEGFAKNFPGFRSSCVDMADDCGELLEVAIVKNLPGAVNFVPLTSKFGKETAFVAASLGWTEADCQG